MLRILGFQIIILEMKNAPEGAFLLSDPYESKTCLESKA